MLESLYMHSPFVSDLVSGSFGLGGLEATLGALFFVVLLFAMTVWSLAWKAFGLWHAAKNGQVKWFILMLLVNTVGIVEIIYLFFFRTNKDTTPILPWLKEWKEKRKAKPVKKEKSEAKEALEKVAEEKEG